MDKLSVFNLFQLDSLAPSVERSLHRIFQHEHVEPESKN